MKKILFLVFALALASCAPVAPTVQPTAVIPPTPVVLVATVLVPVIQTQVVQPTAAPVSLPTQTPQVIVVTATPATGASPAPAATAASAGTATATLPANAGGLSKAGDVLFTNLTRSGSYFNLRCSPQDITFGVSTSNIYVVEVDLYYRMEDLTTQPITISPWKNRGKMTSDGHGNYTITVNTLQNLSPDLRASAKAWFDYQYIAIAKDGNAVGNSGIISQQVYYLKDCP